MGIEVGGGSRPMDIRPSEEREQPPKSLTSTEPGSPESPGLLSSSDGASVFEGSPVSSRPASVTTVSARPETTPEKLARFQKALSAYQKSTQISRAAKRARGSFTKPDMLTLEEFKQWKEGVAARKASTNTGYSHTEWLEEQVANLKQEVEKAKTEVEGPLVEKKKAPQEASKLNELETTLNSNQSTLERLTRSLKQIKTQYEPDRKALTDETDQRKQYSKTYQEANAFKKWFLERNPHRIGLTRAEAKELNGNKSKFEKALSEKITAAYNNYRKFEDEYNQALAGLPGQIEQFKTSIARIHLSIDANHNLERVSEQLNAVPQDLDKVRLKDLPQHLANVEEQIDSLGDLDITENYAASTKLAEKKNSLIERANQLQDRIKQTIELKILNENTARAIKTVQELKIDTSNITLQDRQRLQQAAKTLRNTRADLLREVSLSKVAKEIKTEKIQEFEKVASEIEFSLDLALGQIHAVNKVAALQREIESLDPSEDNFEARYKRLSLIANDLSAESLAEYDQTGFSNLDSSVSFEKPKNLEEAVEQFQNSDDLTRTELIFGEKKPSSEQIDSKLSSRGLAVKRENKGQAIWEATFQGTGAHFSDGELLSQASSEKRGLLEETLRIKATQRKTIQENRKKVADYFQTAFKRLQNDYQPWNHDENPEMVSAFQEYSKQLEPIVRDYVDSKKNPRALSDNLDSESVKTVIDARVAELQKRLEAEKPAAQKRAFDRVSKEQFEPLFKEIETKPEKIEELTEALKGLQSNPAISDADKASMKQRVEQYQAACKVLEDVKANRTVSLDKMSPEGLEFAGRLIARHHASNVNFRTENLLSLIGLQSSSTTGNMRTVSLADMGNQRYASAQDRALLESETPKKSWTLNDTQKSFVRSFLNQRVLELERIRSQQNSSADKVSNDITRRILEESSWESKDLAAGGKFEEEPSVVLERPKDVSKEATKTTRSTRLVITENTKQLARTITGNTANTEISLPEDSTAIEQLGYWLAINNPKLNAKELAKKLGIQFGFSGSLDLDSNDFQGKITPSDKQLDLLIAFYQGRIQVRPGPEGRTDRDELEFLEAFRERSRPAVKKTITKKITRPATPEERKKQLLKKISASQNKEELSTVLADAQKSRILDDEQQEEITTAYNIKFTSLSNST